MSPACRLDNGDSFALPQICIRMIKFITLIIPLYCKDYSLKCKFSVTDRSTVFKRDKPCFWMIILYDNPICHSIIYIIIIEVDTEISKQNTSSSSYAWFPVTIAEFWSCVRSFKFPLTQVLFWNKKKQDLYMWRF